MYKNKKTGIVGIIITIIVLIIIVILSNTDIKKVSFVENIFRYQIKLYKIKHFYISYAILISNLNKTTNTHTKK